MALLIQKRDSRLMITETLYRKCESCWIVHGICQGCDKVFLKEGATFSLEDTPAPHYLVDLDKIPCIKSETRCDYLFIADDNEIGEGWVAPIEMSSGESKKIGKIYEQLQAGAGFLEQVVPHRSSLNFRPVYVGKLTRLRYRELRKKQIKFHDSEFPIKAVGMGKSLIMGL